MPGDNKSILDMTKELVQASIERGEVKPQDVPRLIEEIGNALARISGIVIASTVQGQVPATATAPVALMTEEAPLKAAPPRPAHPAVPVDQSITEDGEWLVCLEDGRRLKVLKRYLRAKFGLTFEEYKARWSLPHDYPSSAPMYQQRKKEEAIRVGLGTTENKAGGSRLRQEPEEPEDAPPSQAFLEGPKPRRKRFHEQTVGGNR